MLIVFEDVSTGKYLRTLTDSSSSLKKATELKELKFKDGMPEILGIKELFFNVLLFSKIFVNISVQFMLISGKF